MAAHDPAVFERTPVAEMARESVERCDDGRLERFPEVTHCHPPGRSRTVDRIAELMVNHFGG